MQPPTAPLTTAPTNGISSRKRNSPSNTGAFLLALYILAMVRLLCVLSNPSRLCSILSENGNVYRTALSRPPLLIIDQPQAGKKEPPHIPTTDLARGAEHSPSLRDCPCRGKRQSQSRDSCLPMQRRRGFFILRLCANAGICEPVFQRLRFR